MAASHCLKWLARTSGQPMFAVAPGSWGFGALLKVLISVMVLRVEKSAVHSLPHQQFHADRLSVHLHQCLTCVKFNLWYSPESVIKFLFAIFLLCRAIYYPPLRGTCLSGRKWERKTPPKMWLSSVNCSNLSSVDQ